MKFKVGEIAIVFNKRRETIARYGCACECMIVEIGPFKAGVDISRVNGLGFQDDSDYMIQMQDGKYFAPLESQLRKRKPPASPFSFDEIISRCKDGTITEPEEA